MMRFYLYLSGNYRTAGQNAWPHFTNLRFVTCQRQEFGTSSIRFHSNCRFAFGHFALHLLLFSCKGKTLQNSNNPHCLVALSDFQFLRVFCVPYISSHRSCDSKVKINATSFFILFSRLLRPTLSLKPLIVLF